MLNGCEPRAWGMGKDDGVIDRECVGMRATYKKSPTCVQSMQQNTVSSYVGLPWARTSKPSAAI